MKVIGLKDRWIEALRSGKYQQGEGALHPSRKRFCCLGVLCDLVDASRWRPDGQNDTEGFYWEHPQYKGIGLPPDSVLDAVGITTTQAINLSEDNDSGHSFAQIADAIERGL